MSLTFTEYVFSSEKRHITHIDMAHMTCDLSSYLDMLCKDRMFSNNKHTDVKKH